MRKERVGFAVCGSFCTHAQVLRELEKLVQLYETVIPIASEISAFTDTRFGTSDDLMERLDRRYPGYGFARHKGYGTPEHLAALRQLGPSPLHRLSFRKVRPEEPDTPHRRQGLLL